MPGQEDDLDRWPVLPDVLQDLLAVDPGHLAIQDDHVDVQVAAQHLDGIVAVADGFHLVAAQLQAFRERDAELGFVVDDQKLGHRRVLPRAICTQ